MDDASPPLDLSPLLKGSYDPSGLEGVFTHPAVQARLRSAVAATLRYQKGSDREPRELTQAIVASVLGKAHESSGLPAPTIRSESSDLGWLHKVFRNAGFDLARSQRAQKRAGDATPFYEGHASVPTPHAELERRQGERAQARRLEQILETAKRHAAPHHRVVFFAEYCPSELTTALIEEAVTHKGPGVTRASGLQRSAEETWSLLSEHVVEGDCPEETRRLVLGWIVRSAAPAAEGWEAWSKRDPKEARRAADTIRKWVERASQVVRDQLGEVGR